ncbi:MAG TPA: peptidase domain-containing ABC transporter [Burkholderiales bacterium]|nr:peptidase domain-containing ABC transporter [Burkholderiales bacterium]
MTTNQPHRPLSADDFIWALGSLCRVNRLPFDPVLLRQQFPGPHDLAALQRAAKALGLRIAFQAATAEELHAFPLPVLAFVHPMESSEPTDEPGACSPAANDDGVPASQLGLVVRADNERILYFESDSQTPVMLSVAEFSRRFTGQIILAKAAAQEVADPDQPAEQKAFGFRWFVPELLKHKAIWRDVLLASLAIQLIALATPLFTQVIIDKVVVHHTMNTLIVIGVALAVFMLFGAAMTWVRQYLVLHTGNRVDAVLGTQVFEHLIQLPARYYESRPTGVVVARLHGVETIREFVSSAAVTLILDLPFLLIFLGVMFYYSVTLTLISLALLGVIVVLSLLIAPLFRDKLNQQFLLGARNQAFLTEYVAGMETVKSLQMEPQLRGRFGDYMAQYLKAGFAAKQLGNSYNVAANGLEQLMTLAILCVGAWTVMNNTDFTIGMLVAFQMFAGKLSQPLLRLVGLWQQFQQADIAVARLADVMNAPTEPYSVVPARENGGRGEIRIQNVAFRYDEQLPYLYENLNLTIQPGEAIAVMGPSGCGKSTLAKLLQGFRQPSDGQITLDGRDIRHLAANELRSCFGVVPQETVLFAGTIHDNLLLANPDAPFEHVIDACKMAEVHAVIEQLPNGYQTEIGERGVGLSGGQKQRLAIARALLKRPKILIFDEATSNLDGETAAQFAKTVNALKGKATMLFITHQMPKGLSIDRVVNLGQSATTPSRSQTTADAEIGA